MEKNGEKWRTKKKVDGYQIGHEGLEDERLTGGHGDVASLVAFDDAARRRHVLASHLFDDLAGGVAGVDGRQHQRRRLRRRRRRRVQARVDGAARRRRRRRRRRVDARRRRLGGPSRRTFAQRQLRDEHGTHTKRNSVKQRKQQQQQQQQQQQARASGTSFKLDTMRRKTFTKKTKQTNNENCCRTHQIESL